MAEAPAPARCNCGELFPSLRSLRQHQRNCNSVEIVIDDQLPHPCPNCAKRFKRKCNLVQHLARCGPPLLHDMRCRWCNKTFESLAGLRQHQRRSHPAEYNVSNQATAEAAPTTAFSNLELGDMAREEATFEGTNINMHLASLFQKKHEAVKYQRRKDSYKAMVARIKSDIEEADEDAPDEPPPPPDIDQESDSESVFDEVPAIEVPETNQPPIPTPEPIPSPRPFTRRQSEPATLLEDAATNDYRAYFSSLLENEVYSIEERQLLQSLAQQSNNIPELIDAQLLSLTTRYSQRDRNGEGPRRPKRTNRGKKYQGHSAKRAQDFKANQEDFYRNRKGLARRILEDDIEAGNPVHPSVEDVTNLYQNRFGGPPEADTSPIGNFPIIEDEQGIKLFVPITEDEVNTALSRTKSLSAGPDGLNIQHLRKMPLHSVLLLLNVVYFTGFIPASWKSGRTVLIPKGGDLNDANNWRPITITSVWSRILNRILAGRFSHLPFCPLQAGFREIDGCLSNAIVLQAITKTARKLTSPYCILALDLAKAFDTIQHTSIRRALQRFRVHGKTIDYIMQSYNGATTTIQVGRDTTLPININCGVRQGRK